MLNVYATREGKLTARYPRVRALSATLRALAADSGSLHPWSGTPGGVQRRLNDISRLGADPEGQAIGRIPRAAQRVWEEFDGLRPTRRRKRLLNVVVAIEKRISGVVESRGRRSGPV